MSSYAEESRRAARGWKGPVRRYDLLKEVTIATIVVFAIVAVLSLAFAAPHAPAITLERWARAAPDDFTATALAELTGSSDTAQYGPPYNNGTASVQYLGPVSFQKLGGIAIPVDTAQDFVIGPLKASASSEVGTALAEWEGASEARRRTWRAAAASSSVRIRNGRVELTNGGDTGPVAPLLTALLALAGTGGLDAQLVDAPGSFYSEDYTRSLLFLADGQYMAGIADGYHLLGEQWGVMNEIGSWPGQPWLAPYALWYHIPPWSTSGTDISVVVTVLGLALVVFLVPFIPGLRSLPKALGVYKLVWRSYYARYGRDSSSERRE